MKEAADACEAANLVIQKRNGKRESKFHLQRLLLKAYTQKVRVSIGG